MLGFKVGWGQVAIFNSVLRIGLIENIFGPVMCFYEEKQGASNIRTILHRFWIYKVITEN